MSHALNLISMCGSRRITLDELSTLPPPLATRTHTPIPHSALYHLVSQEIDTLRLGEISQHVHTLTPDGQRYFGLLEITHNTTWSLLVGLRNSHDKAFAAGIACGSGVLVCDNLSFSGEVKVARRHTANISDDLPDLISDTMVRFKLMRELQARRIERYQWTSIDNERTVHTALIRALDQKIITSSKLPKVLHEYREPSFRGFETYSAWRLFNAFTTVLRPRADSNDLLSLPAKTQRLHTLMDDVCARRLSGIA